MSIGQQHARIDQRRREHPGVPSEFRVVDEGLPAGGIEESDRRGPDDLDERRGDVVLELDAALTEEHLVPGLTHGAVVPADAGDALPRRGALGQQDQVVAARHVADGIRLSTALHEEDP